LDLKFWTIALSSLISLMHGFPLHQPLEPNIPLGKSSFNPQVWMWLEMRCNSERRGESRREECKVGTISQSLWFVPSLTNSHLFYRLRAANEYAKGIKETLWSWNEIGLGPHVSSLRRQYEKLGWLSWGTGNWRSCTKLRWLIEFRLMPIKNKKKNLVAWVRDRTIPAERASANFCG
jgi:hypothetical protein